MCRQIGTVFIVRNSYEIEKYEHSQNLKKPVKQNENKISHIHVFHCDKVFL